MKVSRMFNESGQIVRHLLFHHPIGVCIEIFNVVEQVLVGRNHRTVSNTKCVDIDI